MPCRSLLFCCRATCLFLVLWPLFLVSYPKTSFPRSTSRCLRTVFPCRQRILCRTEAAETWDLNRLLLSEWKDRSHSQCDLLFGGTQGSSPVPRRTVSCDSGPMLAGLTRASYGKLLSCPLGRHRLSLKSNRGSAFSNHRKIKGGGENVFSCKVFHTCCL